MRPLKDTTNKSYAVMIVKRPSYCREVSWLWGDICE